MCACALVVCVCVCVRACVRACVCVCVCVCACVRVCGRGRRRTANTSDGSGCPRRRMCCRHHSSYLPPPPPPPPPPPAASLCFRVASLPARLPDHMASPPALLRRVLARSHFCGWRRGRSAAGRVGVGVWRAHGPPRAGAAHWSPRNGSRAGCGAPHRTEAGGAAVVVQQRHLHAAKAAGRGGGARVRIAGSRAAGGGGGGPGRSRGSGCSRRPSGASRAG